MKKYVLGMDIGGTNTRMGLIDEDYKLEDFTIVSTERLLGQENPVDVFLDIVRDYMGKHADKNIAAISAGFPSTIDRDRKVVLSTPNIPGFDNVAIVDRLEEELKIPAYLETDVDMLILYDMHVNDIPDKGITCGFYFGTGLGNAVVINGELLVGKTGAAAELGHIPTRGVSGLCGCGNTSCVELVASGYRLRQITEEEFPETFISNVFTEHSDSPQIKQFIDDLAAAVATEINILDPHYIILGGGLTLMPDFPFDMLKEAIYRYARKPFPAEELSYINAAQGQENGVIGAGILAFKKMK